MVKIVATIFFICISINTIAQQVGPAESSACNFLKDVKFKNGVDTITVKAIFQDAAEMVLGGLIFRTLDKEKKLKSKDFNYQIGFQPENCLKIYYGPTNVHKPKPIFGKIPIIGKLVYIKCVALKDVSGKIVEYLFCSN